MFAVTLESSRTSAIIFEKSRDDALMIFSLTLCFHHKAYARPHVWGLLTPAVQRLKGDAGTSARAVDFQGALDRLRTAAWTNLRGLLAAVVLTSKPTGLTTLRCVRIDDEGPLPVCFFRTDVLKNILKREPGAPDAQLVPRARKQAQDHLDFNHKNNFLEFMNGFGGYKNEFLLEAHGDATPSAAPDAGKWAEAFIIANLVRSTKLNKKSRKLT